MARALTVLLVWCPLPVVAAGCTSSWTTGVTGEGFLRLGPIEAVIALVVLVAAFHSVTR